MINTDKESNNNWNIFTTEDHLAFESFKKQHSSNPLVVIPSGGFETAEAVAIILLKICQNFNNLRIVRTRNEQIIKDSDVAIGTGGLYSIDKNRFDHHVILQASYFDTYRRIQMSCAGLVYKQYGKQAIAEVLNSWGLYQENCNHLDIIYKKLYENFILSVDACANQINQFKNQLNEPRYVNTTCLDQRVKRLNPDYDEYQLEETAQFKEALSICEEELIGQIRFIVKSYIPAYRVVQEAVANRFKTHKSGKIISLDNACPWKEHLFKIEHDLSLKNQIKFVVMNVGEEGFRTQTIPTSGGGFSFRKGLLEKWRGLDKEELCKVTGFRDIVFVHTTGYIGGSKTLNTAIKMAEESL